MTGHCGFEGCDRLFPRRSILAVLPALFAGRLEGVGVASEHQVPRAFNLLPNLVGGWRFTLGARTGTREIRALYGDYAVEYDESFDGSEVRGRGFLAFDAARGHYLSLGVHNAPGAAGASVGTPQNDGRTVIFRPSTPGPDEPDTESWLVVDGANTFRYEARRQRAGTSTLVWTAHFERR